MEIQFKKLVWEQHGLFNLNWTCANMFGEFLIEMKSGKPVLYISAKGVFIDNVFNTVEEAKQYAQEWLEQQLTQFIETSEIPIKKKKQPKIDSLIASRERLVNRIAEIEIQIRDLKNAAQ